MRSKWPMFLVFAALVATATAAAAGVSATARELAQGARILDARAGGLERTARTERERALQLLEQASESRARARRGSAEQRPALDAAADELELRAALTRSRALRAGKSASRLRAEARQLRALAKARVDLPEAPESARGWLSIASDTSCLIRVDGVPRGTSPLPAFAVSAGAHRIECELEDGRRTSQLATVRSGASRTASFRFQTDGVISPF